MKKYKNAAVIWIYHFEILRLDLMAGSTTLFACRNQRGRCHIDCFSCILNLSLILSRLLVIWVYLQDEFPTGLKLIIGLHQNPFHNKSQCDCFQTIHKISDIGQLIFITHNLFSMIPFHLIFKQ